MPIAKPIEEKLLTDLAYMCDYDKGGDTVTAIGLENNLHTYTFWIASNAHQTTKIVRFLESLLTDMQQVSAKATVSVPVDGEDLAVKCITFAALRIKKYRSHLKPLLRRCLENLENKGDSDSKSAQTTRPSLSRTMFITDRPFR